MSRRGPDSSSARAESGMWMVVLVLFYAGLIWFAKQTLANRGIERLSVWELTPTLLGEYLFPTVEPNEPPRESGWEYFPERFDLVAVSGAILLFATATGRWALRAVFREPGSIQGSLDRIDRLYWSLVVGLALWGTGTLGLGLAGGLSQGLFWCIGLAILIVESYLTVRERKAHSEAVLAVPRDPFAPWCLLAIVPFLLAIWLGSLQPPNDFDVKEYHLGGAKEFYQQGRIGFLSHDVYTSFPFLTEMLCLSGMVLRGDWYRGALAGQAVLAAFAPLTALGIYLTARRWIDRGQSRGAVVAWSAVLIHLSCPWVYRISIIAYAEGGLACYLLATFTGVWRTVTTESALVRRRWSFLTGLAAGAAAGCKYPGVLTVVIPAGLGLCLFSRPSEEGPGWIRRRGMELGAYVTGGWVTWGPWLLKNLSETGNPVYPLMYGVFGGRDWDAASHAKWQAGHPLPRFTSLTHVLGDTRDRLADVFLGSDWQSAFYVALAPAAFWAIGRTRQRVMVNPQPAPCVLLGALSYAAYLFLTWQFLTHRIDRFWVPMLPILSLLAGAGLGEIWSAVRSATADRTREVQLVLRGSIALPVGLVVICQLALATSPLGGNNSYLSPLSEARRLVKTPCVGLVESLPLEATDKVLFVGDAELFDAEFAYEYNTVFDHSILERDCSMATPDLPAEQQQLRPAEEIRSRWRERGVTHLVVNWSELLRYRTTYQYTDFVHPSRFNSLVQAGVLEPIPRPMEQTHVMWEGVASEKQAEALRWAPQLKESSPFGDTLRVYDVYRVR